MKKPAKRTSKKSKKPSKGSCIGSQVPAYRGPQKPSHSDGPLALMRSALDNRPTRN